MRARRGTPHHFDRAVAEARLPEALDDLDALVAYLGAGREVRLASVMGVAMVAAGCATVVGDGDGLGRGLDIVVDTGAALCELTGLAPGTVHRFSVAGRAVSVPAGPADRAGPGVWLQALYAALARDRAGDVSRLVAVDQPPIVAAARHGDVPAYLPVWMAMLRALWRNEPVTGLLIEAVQGTDPEILSPLHVAAALGLHAPVMEMCTRMLSRDGPALAAAHDHAVGCHRRYHTVDEIAERQATGAIALGVVAFREIAAANGLPRLAPGPYTPDTR